MAPFDDDHQLRDGIDRSLAVLPGDFAVAGAGATRLVIGPPGAFVLEGCAPERLEVGAARVAGLAAATRAILADHVSWVPFVDGLVVVAGRTDPHPSVTMVPVDLLVDTLVQGPEVVSPPVLSTVHALLRESRLGVWRLAFAVREGRIDLSEPARQTSTS
ncbi:MAG: hypothetical protein R2726_20760 [Acidimicrobiales bacterium]